MNRTYVIRSVIGVGSRPWSVQLIEHVRNRDPRARCLCARLSTDMKALTPEGGNGDLLQTRCPRGSGALADAIAAQKGFKNRSEYLRDIFLAQLAADAEQVKGGVAQAS